jgi:chromosomal replication initiation ATPase DnaA
MEETQQLPSPDDILLLQLLRRIGRLEQRVIALEHLRAVPSPTSDDLSAETIVSTVCLVFEVDSALVHSAIRTAEIAWARQVCMHLMTQRLEWPAGKVGSYFKRHHSSTWHALRAVSDRISVDSHAREMVERVNGLLNQPRSKPQEAA